MNPTSQMLLIAAVVFSAARHAGANTDVERKVDILATQMTRLEKNLEKVSDQVEQMYRFTHKVEKAFFAVNGVNVSKIYTDSNQGLPVSIQELRWEPLDAGTFRYVVRYLRHDDDVTCKVGIPPISQIEPVTAVIDGRIEEASFIVKEDSEENMYGGVSFNFHSNKMRTGVFVDLGHPPEESKDELVVLTNDEFQVPYLETDPPREIIYQEGHDVTVKANIPKDANEHLRPLDIDTSAYFFDLEENKFVDAIFDLKNSSFADETKSMTEEWTFSTTLKTSERKISGIIEMSTMNVTFLSILRIVGTWKELYLRPSTQPKPYPKHAIGFLESEFFRVGKENGADVTLCHVGSKHCLGLCQAIGENIFGVMVQRVLPDGRRLPIPTIERWITSDHFIRSVNFNISTQFKDDIYENQKYVCTATGFDGDTATKEIVVRVIMEAQIIENSTTAILTQNGTMSEMRLECSAAGQPLPNITFNLSFEYDYMDGVAADQTWMSGDGLYVTSSKTVTYNSSQPYGMGKGRLNSAGCSAVVPYGMNNYEDIPLPTSL